jgi:uncharacterized membrane protein YbhN (UPF0104 family)
MNTRALPGGKPAPRASLGGSRDARRRSGPGAPLRRAGGAQTSGGGGNAQARRGGFGARLKAAWPRLKPWLTGAFFLLVAWMIWRFASTVRWAEVLLAVRAYPGTTLLAAATLAATSHALYSTYDLLGRHVTGHPLSTATVMRITFISYAFNLNLGSLVGGIALRYRLYSRQGLDAGLVTRVLTLSMLTNWLGYLLLAGVAFCFWPLTLPDSWGVTPTHLRLGGAALLAAALGWVALCAFSSRREISVRGHSLQLPSLGLTAVQIALSCTNWLLISGVVYLLMPERIGYPSVLAVMLIAAVAGVITHVPAGLGVLEAVFVALLSHQAPASQLLAALLTYRALYYLGPFALALIAYLATEARRAPAHSGAARRSR